MKTSSKKNYVGPKVNIIEFMNRNRICESSPYSPKAEGTDGEEGEL